MVNQRKNILIIEDEEKIVEFIESYLINSGYYVYKSFTGLSGLELFYHEDIDLILLDLMLPDLSGEEVCKRIRKTSMVPILMITAKSSEESIINGLNIGADDYLTKPFSPRQMVARVNALLRRTNVDKDYETILSFNHGDLVLHLNEYKAYKKAEAINLTPSEFKILITLQNRPNKVFTREELITLAFDGDYNGYDRTIDSHIKNLRGKIEDDTRELAYIRTIRGVGYQFGGTKDESLFKK